MAGRIRTIKPELLEDEKTSRLTSRQWRLFVSSLLLADDYGNFRGTEQWLQSQVFWGEVGVSVKEVTLCVTALAEVGLLSLYSVHGQKYAHINGWDKHQRVDKPGKPRVPGQEEADSDAPFAGSQEIPANIPGSLAPDLRPPTSDHDHRPPTSTTDRKKEIDKKVGEVLLYFRATHPARGKHIKPGHPDWGRIEKLLPAFGVDGLCLAIDGNAIDKWHVANRQHSVESVFRNATKVEGFIDTAMNGPPDNGSKLDPNKSPFGRSLKAMEEWANEPEDDETGVRSIDGKVTRQIPERTSG